MKVRISKYFMWVLNKCKRGKGLLLRERSYDDSEDEEHSNCSKSFNIGSKCWDGL